MSGACAVPWETDPEVFAFEERAAIREYDGRLSRAAAERLALGDVIDARRTRRSALAASTAPITTRPPSHQ